MYWPNDPNDLQNSHVLPAWIRKMHEAKQGQGDQLVIWGTGRPRREFMHVDDLADACFFLMQHSDESGLINIRIGTDVTMLELAEMVKRVVGFTGNMVTDDSKPVGIPRKLLDVSRLQRVGWQARIGLEEGLAAIGRDFQGCYPKASGPISQQGESP